MFRLRKNYGQRQCSRYRQRSSINGHGVIERRLPVATERPKIQLVNRSDFRGPLHNASCQTFGNLCPLMGALKRYFVAAIGSQQLPSRADREFPPICRGYDRCCEVGAGGTPPVSFVLRPRPQGPAVDQSPLLPHFMSRNGEEMQIKSFFGVIPSSFVSSRNLQSVMRNLATCLERCTPAQSTRRRAVGYILMGRLLKILTPLAGSRPMAGGKHRPNAKTDYDTHNECSRR